ncbi:hypothetical protein KDA_42080 [Dictyobacter alpinus]|uniref:DUF2795 domain-containing protein n=1 Tax=Dictyobacter alpinus TaxID=2014873 RepID=A0A402BBL5_9CHLR|nr:DUF2795 domain-containing protein [Dictyobacter alpinus]GCE28724.1 hypothetical protein KDA_42080 [Dictyobacter alpinus]
MANVEATQIESYLKDMKFPAQRDEVVAFAQRKGADDQLISQMRRLPEQSFNSVSDVVRVLNSNQGSNTNDRAGSRNQH